ncbi:DeoR/GlpR family DNA-binding transcription regulator [Actinomyces sp. B33]|uniref:DeoR/GlpR family DNA-binding transcription regulator n=1 Tax=Actinomyces sp. B33 TaxID=2942131 RepID=UPI00233FAD26|nr:DeoR/GlpR family DNA-binding transcription regulator [Actinomyces sp. B33]MDC4232469.1 DeoR/GlpR family DNA-binding transcription regulator [Actinomyces sp. B33]
MESTSNRLPAGRKAAIIQQVNSLGQVTVTTLAQHFNVSSDTIRRDLDQLDSDGALIRTHGGAMSTFAVPWHDTRIDDRLRLQPQQKRAIASLAAGLVCDGAVLFINGGSTVLPLIHELGIKRELIIATNNLRLASELNPDSCRDLYVFGGHVRISGQVTIGPVAFASSISGIENDIRADLAFIAVGAFDENGFSTSNLDEAAMLAHMAERARRVAILADSSKAGRRLFASIGPLSLADYLITDMEPSAELLESLHRANVEILTPKTPAGKEN